MAAVSLVTAQTLGYDWNGFSASGLGCGSDSGALNVGLGQSLPPGATGLKVKQIAFAIYGTNSLPAFIQLHGSTATPRLSTSTAVQCCGSGCDLAVQVGVAGYSWYNSPCGQPSCANANKWYYMDFSGTAVGTTEQTGISEVTFYNAGGSQISANMINLGSGSVFFMSYTAIIPSPTPTPSLTKSPVSPSLTASETASTSVSRSVTASGSTDPTDSRSVTASRTESRSHSTTMSASRAPSVSRTTSASATVTSTGVCSDARTYFTGVWTTVVHATATYHVRHWVNVTHDLTPPAEQFIGANPTCTQTSTTCTCTYTGGDNTGGCTINRYATIVYTYGSPQTTTYTTQSPLCAYFFGSTIFIPSGTPSTSMTVSTTRSRAPSVSVTVTPTVTPYLPWFQGLVGCCHNSIDTSVQALNILTPTPPYTNMGINRISMQYWPLAAGTATFTIALMNVAGGSAPGGFILASKTFSVTSPGSFPTYPQQVATFTDLDPISSYVLGVDVEYALAFYNATPGIIDLVLGVSSLSPYFWNGLMTEPTGSFYSVGETNPPEVTFWYQSTNIAFVAVGAGPVISTSPSVSPSPSSSSSVSATTSSSSSVTTAASQSTSVSATETSSPSVTTIASQSTSVSATESSSPSVTVTLSRSSSSSLTGSTAVSQSQSTSSSVTGSTAVSQSQSTSVSATDSSSPSITVTLSRSSSSSVTGSTSVTPTTAVSQSLTTSNSRSSDTTGSPTSSMSVSMSVSTSGSTSGSTSVIVSSSGSFSPSPQSFQQVNNISTAMSATSTPQFMFTAYPTTSPTYSPTQNATLPIIVVDGQATNMTTTNALIGSTLALIIVAVALAAGRYLPAGWAQRFRRMIPQSTIDNFKRDPLGSVTAMVNDPKSMLKNIQVPDSVKSLSEMVPQSIKNKIVPKELQELVGIAPSATVPHIETDTEAVTPETSPQPPASSRKIDIAPPVRREIAPEPIAEEKEEDLSPPPEPEKKEVVNVDAGVIVAKDETKTSGPTLIEIKPEDLEALKAFMDSRNVHHVILQ